MEGHNAPYSSCVPLFKGIGLAQLLNCIFIVYYYNVIISWAYYFLAASFASTLPWWLSTFPHHTHHRSACPDDKQSCFATTDFLDCKADGGVYLNSPCLKSGMAAWQEVLDDPRAWYAPNDTCVFTNGTFCDSSEEAHLSILQPFHLPGAMRNASSQVTSGGATSPRSTSWRPSYRRPPASGSWGPHPGGSPSASPSPGPSTSSAFSRGSRPAGRWCTSQPPSPTLSFSSCWFAQ